MWRTVVPRGGRFRSGLENGESGVTPNPRKTQVDLSPLHPIGDDCIIGERLDPILGPNHPPG